MLCCRYLFLVVFSVCVRLLGAQKDVTQDNDIIQVFQNCKCVMYYQCDENNYIITDGATLINERIDNVKDRIKCAGGKFDGEIVCCKLNQTEPVIDQKNPDEPTEVKKKIACGKQKPLIDVRIFGPDESELNPVAGEFPWIAAIFKKNSDGQYIFDSSGSLIHPKVILTANHYVHKKKADDFKVVVNGQVELPIIGNSTDEERNVVEIVHHEEYNPSSLYNDVALLILDEPYTEGKNFLNRICLPSKNVNMEGMRCLVAGWGKEMIANGGPKTLKKVEVPYIEHGVCQDLLRKTRLGSRFNLHTTFVCAGGEKNKDACKGDGGSPLMCPFSPGEARYFQAGIVAWGIGCGQENVPGVYGNVQEFKKWIKSELKKRGLDDI